MSDVLHDEGAHGHLPVMPHPLKIFDQAQSQGRFLYACAPMVRYSKLAFRQTVHAYGTDLCWTPMILAKEFNRSAIARDSDFTLSTSSTISSPRQQQQQQRQPVTIAQFGANVPLELARASSLVAPYVSGVDLNCGCPQSWACAETLGAALMERRELVRDMVLETRRRLREDGWAVGLEADAEDPRGRSVSVKIRVHKDLRKTIDFIETVLGPHSHHRQIDFLTIHPRTRSTPSTQPINLDALELLTNKYGDRVPILVSGDVFTLGSLPYTSPLLTTTFTSSSASSSSSSPPKQTEQGEGEAGVVTTTMTTTKMPHLPKLRGLMSARALLANPALFAGHETCPWEAVEEFMNNVARAPLPFALVQHHLGEMCGPGYGPDKTSLLTKKERIELYNCTNMCDLIDFMDDKMSNAAASAALPGRPQQQQPPPQQGQDGIRRFVT